MRYIVIDVETDGLDPRKDALVSVGLVSQNKSVFLPIYHLQSNELPKENINKLQNIISKVDLIVGHNIKFDLQFLLKHNIDFVNQNVWDTGIAEFIISAQRAKRISLKDLAIKYSDLRKLNLDVKNVKASEYDIKCLEEYNIIDCKVTQDVFIRQWEIAKKLNLTNLIIICSNFSKTLSDIEFNGAKIDTEYLDLMHNNLEKEINEIENRLKEISGYDWINFNSSEQLSAVLFGGTIEVDGYSLSYHTLKSGALKVRKKKAKIPVVLEGLGFSTSCSEKTKNGYWSVSDSVVKQLRGRSKKQKEFINEYIKWRKLQTILEKYTSKYKNEIDDGFVYPSFNQTYTSTGRLSCAKPNIQQIPRPDESIDGYNIKDLFVSRFENGVILDVDFSQLEWRVCAFLCQDENMIKEIVEGIDAHKQNASIAFNIPIDSVTKQHRQIAKMVSFGLIYGQTAYGLAQRPDIPIDTPEDAQKVIDAVYDKYRKLKEWHDKLYIDALNKKKIISPSGRRFVFEDASNQLTQIKNYPVQSLATADIVPLILYLAWKEIKNKKLKAVPFNTVHDCIVYDCADIDTAKQVASIIQSYIRNSGKYLKEYLNIDFNIPLDSEAEIGKCWGKLEALH